MGAPPVSPDFQQSPGYQQTGYNQGVPMQGPPGYGAQQMPLIQPQPTPQHTTVIVQQPTTAQNPLMNGELFGKRDWSTGLMDCFSNIPICMYR